MIFPIISRTFSANSYLLVDEKVAVIDPGIFTSHLREKIEKEKVKVNYIINTHCHYDHLAGNLKLREKFSGKILIHESDALVLEKGEDELMLARTFNSPPLKIHPDGKLKDGDRIDLGKRMKLKVIHTPGHTPGSICLYDEEKKVLFSGDTLFNGGLGRTDLPGGNWQKLKSSLEKLIQVHQEQGIKKLYPGHGSFGSGEDIEKVYEFYFGEK